MSRPNILYLHSHDTGRYIEPYGYPVPTPNLQAFAEQGVVFRQAFCGGPTCSPSRAALLTGQAPHSSGMIGLAHMGFTLHDYSQHIVHTLRGAGYHSTLVGMQHVAPDSRMIGYDEIAPVPGVEAEPVVAAAKKVLRETPAQPFFLDVGFFETHRIFPPPGLQEDARYCRPPAPLPDTPETRADFAAFRTSARRLDHAMGAVLEALDEYGLAANTLVICTTDHGIAFPGMKCNLTDHGTGVMLMMRGPGGFAGGQVCDAMVSQVDIFPTVCDVLGIERPAWLQGTSLLPLVRGEAKQVNEEVFSEVTYHAAYEPQRSVRTPRYKYIRRFGGRPTMVPVNCDDSLSKTVWMEAGWPEQTLATEQLYDLTFDPNETRNLAPEAEMTEVLNDMRGRLERWMQKTGDPLLHGPVPLPVGAAVWGVEAESLAEPRIVVG